MNGKDCQVKVSLSSNVQVSARLQTTVTEFFSNGGVTKFVDKMCAYLNISTDRLKVVGVYSGSAVVDFFVITTPNVTVDPNNPVADESTSTTVQDAEQSQLASISKMILSAPSSSVNLDGLGPIISASTVVSIINTDGSLYTPQDVSAPDSAASTAMIVGIAFAGLVVIILLGLSVFFIVRRMRAKKTAKVNDAVRDPMDDSDHKDVIKVVELGSASVVNFDALEERSFDSPSPDKSFEKWEKSFIVPTSSRRKFRAKSNRK